MRALVVTWVRRVLTSAGTAKAPVSASGCVPGSSGVPVVSCVVSPTVHHDGPSAGRRGARGAGRACPDQPSAARSAPRRRADEPTENKAREAAAEARATAARGEEWGRWAQEVQGEGGGGGCQGEQGGGDPAAQQGGGDGAGAGHGQGAHDESEQVEGGGVRGVGGGVGLAHEGEACGEDEG